MKNEYVSALGMLVTVILLLRARARKKEEERKNDQTIPPYEPIEPESLKIADTAVTAISRVSQIYNIAVGLLVLAAVAYLFFVDPLTRWIILGTAALMILIALVHRRWKARKSSDRNTIDAGRDGY